MRRNSAFTLLELLIVLAILGGLLGLVAPNISFNASEEQLKQEAELLRSVLQDQIDQAWLQGESVFVRVENGSITLFRLQDNVWQESDRSWQISDLLRLRLIVDESQLDAAIEALKGPTNADLVFLSSGEYLPFRFLLTNDQSDELSILGDGVNALALE